MAINEFFKNLDICVGFDLNIRNQRSNVLKTTFENFFSPGSLCRPLSVSVADPLPAKTKTEAAFHGFTHCHPYGPTERGKQGISNTSLWKKLRESIFPTLSEDRWEFHATHEQRLRISVHASE